MRSGCLYISALLRAVFFAMRAILLALWEGIDALFYGVLSISARFLVRPNKAASALFGLSLAVLFLAAFAPSVPSTLSVPSAYAASQWNYAKPGFALDPAHRESGAAQTRSNFAQGNYGGGSLQVQSEHDWALRIRNAAVAQGDMVLLGEIAEPVGAVPAGLWDSLRNQALWPAPPEPGKPLQINKTRLDRALRDTLGDLAQKCILPNSLAIQKGGAVLSEDDLRRYVVSFLTPQTNAMPGTAEWADFRLPPYIFLEHAHQRVNLEPGTVAPGRVTFRFIVQEADGTVVRRAAGAAFLNLWVEVPAAARPLNKGDSLHVHDIAFSRVNAAHLKSMPWDGKGGPWQMVRSVGTGQVIYSQDLLGEAMIQRGDIVNLVYAKGAIRMEIKAEAMSDGAPGAIIAVRNLQSKKQIYATVQDSTTVIIK